MLYATTATTDLDAVRANLAGIRARVGQRLILAAVKANGYGHGAVEVARMIERTDAADWLGVATVPEGLELRAAGIGLPILKFSPAFGAEIGAALAAGVTLTVTDEATIDDAAAAADALGLVAPVHLKVDTGMRRIGCPPELAAELALRVEASPHLTLQGVFSHLPISDHPRGDDFTAHQIETFAAAADDVETAVGHTVVKHLANSGGVLAHPASWFDMVRPGVMVYGTYPDPAVERTVELRPALRWTTAVTFVKTVRAGETVGYGRTWTADRDTTIATLCIGYGDGYSRLLSNRGRVLIGGRGYPIVGRVCMDQTMVDLGPETDVRVGDEAVLIGRDGAEEIACQEVADLMGTITYEVTCLVNARVSREYVGG